MAAKKKTTKKTKKRQESSKAARRKMAAVKKSVKKRLATKRVTSRKESAENSSSKNAAPLSKAPVGRKPMGARGRAQGKSQAADAMTFPRERGRAPSGQESGDLQGLSNTAGSDSESVEELMEEGNAFEADVVTGVEAAGDDQKREVHTHEVPEDDVPGEYLDKD